MVWPRALLVWLSFGVVAFTVGWLREVLLTPRIGELRAHQIGTVTVCLLVTAIIVVAVRHWPLTERQALTLGALWVVLTVVFELVVFHFLVGVPWQRLVGDYNLAAGRLWPLVLLTELIVPWLVVRRRSRG